MLYRFLDPRRAMHSLSNRSFRWFVMGRIAGAPTGPMRSVAQGWLIYSLTGSALALGWVVAARAAVSVVVAPVAGVLADRLEKRLVMIMARAVVIMTSLIVGVLFFSGKLQPWHIVATAMVDGAAFTVLDSAMLSIVSELVDSETLLNAISVVSVVEGLVGIMGAMLAGLIINLVGSGGVYLSMAALFFLAACTHLQLPKGLVGNNNAGSVGFDLANGVRYILARPVMVGLLGVAFARLVFVQPFSAFLPAFARNDLGFDAAGLALLTSASGLGGLVSSLAIAWTGNPRNKGELLLASGIAAAASAIVFMLVRASPAPFLFIALGGGFANAADVFTRTLMQSACDLSYRGRVTSIAIMLSSAVTLVALPAGALADRYGVLLVVIVLALLVIATHIAAAVWLPDVRKLR